LLPGTLGFGFDFGFVLLTTAFPSPGDTRRRLDLAIITALAVALAYFGQPIHAAARPVLA
jgi:hypothetical protein